MTRAANRARIRELIRECRFYRDHKRATEIIFQVHAKEWAKARREALIDLREAFYSRHDVAEQREAA
jgi:hypothetical protein